MGLLTVVAITFRRTHLFEAVEVLQLHIAEALVAAGASVMLSDVDARAGEAAAAGLAGRGPAVGFTPLDVTREDQWARAAEHTRAALGGFDLLVNNAGIEITALVIDASADDLRRMFDVNVVGTMLGVREAFRIMRPGGAAGQGGAVINIASVAATIAFPAIAGYSASKSAVDRLTRIAAVESGKLGYGIRVNCLYPGLVPTDMGMKLAQDIVAAGLAPDVEAAVGGVIGQTPLGRLGTVPDMADAVVFLASDAARFITGIGLPVDGGMGT